MTKPITKARLLQTLENIYDWHQRLNGRNSEVMHVLCCAGMQTVFDEATGRHDPLRGIKTDLELTVLEVRKFGSPLAEGLTRFRGVLGSVFVHLMECQGIRKKQHD